MLKFTKKLIAVVIAASFFAGAGDFTAAEAAPPRFADLPPVADIFLPPPPPDFLPIVPGVQLMPELVLPDFVEPVIPIMPLPPDVPRVLTAPEILDLDALLYDAPEIALPPPKNLTDIDGHWASAVILQAFNRGIVDVYDGRVRPNSPMTRGEAAFAMERLISANYQNLARLGFTYPGAAEPVVGVPNNHPFMGSINLLARYGMVGQGIFLPDEYVSRQEFSMLMLALLRRLPATSASMQIQSADFVLTQYSDHGEIYDWARESVAVMTIHGFMGGGDMRFRPTDEITRAEAYTTLMNIDRWLVQ